MAWAKQKGAVGGARRAALILRGLAYVCIAAAIAGLFWLVPAAPTIAVIKATSEFVSYAVAVPDLAQIPLAGYALFYEAPGERRPLCLAGILTPEQGTQISLRRFGKNPAAIILERGDDQPAASFDEASGDIPEALEKAAWIRLEAPATEKRDGKDGPELASKCPGDATRLPVYGQVQIGTELRPPSRGAEPSSGILIDGTIDLFAKTIELSQLWDGATRIYPTSISSMPIPPGSQVSEFVAKGASPTAWAGYVELDAKEALAVRLTTPATRIQILRPGIGIKPEILSASLFAQLTHDPTLLLLQIMAVFLFSALRTASSVLDWYSTRGLTMTEPTGLGAVQGNEPAAAPPPAEKARVP